MPDLTSALPHTDPRPGRQRGSEHPTTRWAVWAVFAASMMILLGSLQALEGLVAIFDGEYYRADSGDLLDLSRGAWGWTHLLLGVLIVLSGLGVLSGNTAARAVGVALAALSALVNLVHLDAYPVWSCIAITVDVLVIYTLTVHGGELRGR